MNECARLCAVFQNLSLCDRALVGLILLQENDRELEQKSVSVPR